MTLSKYALELMGFTEYPETDELQINFRITKAYSLRGMLFETDCAQKQSKVALFGVNCTSVIAQSINDACQLLTGDVFTEDEEKWLSDNETSPPFLLIHFCESTHRTLSGGFRKEEDGKICVFDAFPENVSEIQTWENDVEPRIITALTVHLSTLDRQVAILPVERSIFGTTQHGKLLLDVKF